MLKDEKYQMHSFQMLRLLDMIGTMTQQEQQTYEYIAMQEYKTNSNNYPFNQ